MKACAEYFQWVEDNPLKEEKLFHFQGRVITHKADKMRAMTLGGLCIFLDINKCTWFDYVKKDGFSNVTTQVDAIIRDQKFTGAAADLLNANIIARDLGLADKREHGGPGGTPIRMITSSMTAQEAAEAYADTLLESKK